MHVILYDDEPWRANMYPLALTRPVSNLRVGILTIDEKWKKWLGCSISFATATHLSRKFPLERPTDGSVWMIRGNLLPDVHLVERILSLQNGEALADSCGIAIAHIQAADVGIFLQGKADLKRKDKWIDCGQITYPEDIFLLNGQEIGKDFTLLTKGRTSAILSGSNRLLGEQIFIEPGASIECATLNATTGPIYIGKNSQIWEGCLVRGAFALGESSILKMGTKIYSNVSIGPESTMGGELNSCVVWGRSAKGHHGYFGSGVMGEWCNWGAGTSNSNLKNNYKNVRLYHYPSHSFRDTGRQVCGIVMGDHVRCAIHTAFYTGTVVGVGAHVFGTEIPAPFIPDFAWGGQAESSFYELSKMFETCELVFQRRNRIFDEIEKEIVQSVFQLTNEYRS